jgi:hypothetical protein
MILYLVLNDFASLYVGLQELLHLHQGNVLTYKYKSNKNVIYYATIMLLGEKIFEKGKTLIFFGDLS